MARPVQATAGSEIQVTGVVQGVGFRPHVYKLATSLGLCGWVLNSTAGVTIRLEGEAGTIERFISQLRDAPPPLASIERMSVIDAAPEGYGAFFIHESHADGDTDISIPPDVGSCADCLREFNDPRDRRYGYAFTNCVNCGPRFSITGAAPYDRHNTSMAGFAMCPECASEYADPGDRRFHAEPNACPRCGPHIKSTDGSDRAEGVRHDDNTDAATGGVGVPAADAATCASIRSLLKSGRLLAIKGVGGYHLACNALDEAAVGRMRERKHREAKPFALMCRDIDVVREHCELSVDEERVLTSPARPIVLVRRREPGVLCDEIAPGLDTLGVMLPYTPLHYGLFDGDLGVLVMTSANISGDPLILTEDEAYAELGGLADNFVTHDREIVNRADDSVVMLVAGAEYFVRRARGYVPRSVALPRETPPALAVGGDLKSVFAFARGNKAIPSQYFGDLDNIKNFDAYERGMGFFGDFLKIRPELVVCDLHPAYASAEHAERLAAELDVPLIRVQHHKAHAASVMADNGLDEKVLGVVCDGTGYGEDGSIWGFEFFYGDYDGMERVGSLAQFAQPRGDDIQKNPLHMAALLLYALWGDEAKVRAALPASEPLMPFVRAQTASESLSISSSSCGRLFDAASALCGFTGRTTYEGEAAMRMEALARRAGPVRPYGFSLDEGDGIRLSWGFLGDMADDMLRGTDPVVLAARFHMTFIEAVAAIAERLAERFAVEKIVFSGGTFQNRFVINVLAERFRERGLTPFFHRQVPTNDGGIALGQVLLALAGGR